MEKVTKTIDEKCDAAIFSIEEDAAYPDIRAAVANYLKGPATKYSIWDFTKLIKHLTSEELRNMGVVVSQLSDPKKERFDLLVVPNPLQYGLARMYTSFTAITKKDYVPFKTLVFRTREKALAWIQQADVK
jgi:hypothetical protein